MPNSHSATCSTFSHHSLPSVDVSSMHYCQSPCCLFPIQLLSKIYHSILSLPIQTIGRENYCSLISYHIPLAQQKVTAIIKMQQSKTTMREQVMKWSRGARKRKSTADSQGIPICDMLAFWSEVYCMKAWTDCRALQITSMVFQIGMLLLHNRYFFLHSSVKKMWQKQRYNSQIYLLLLSTPRKSVSSSAK